MKITLYTADEVKHLVAEVNLVEETLFKVFTAVKNGNLLDLDNEVKVCCIEGYIGATGKWDGGIDPQSGVIYINPVQTVKNLFNTVVHELIHAEQMFCRMLGFDALTNKSTWFGQQFNEPEDFNEYLNLPWELDAYRRERILSEKIKHNML